jgi:hypothetical protein
MLTIMRIMRERVWEAANVKLEVVTIDTDTTVHTLYGQQMGGRKGYNPKNKGKKSYQPMLTFIAETREYVWGELRNGDRPSGKQIRNHLRNVQKALPPSVKQIYGRADSGFYCQDAVEAYEECDARFVICARKTSRLVEELRQAEWKSSPKTDADAECEFRYQPEGWSKLYRFVALRKEKPREEQEAGETEQYQLFETSQYKYRVFVTDMSDPIYFVVWFYGQRGGAENLIKEANNDAGLAAHPSGRFDVNGNHFQLAMLAYNHDEHGFLVAYAGRSIDGTEPKYRFPARFRKSVVLFNLHRAVGCGDSVIVVEGFFDAVNVHQAGLPCVVALTSLLPRVDPVALG